MEREQAAFGQQLQDLPRVDKALFIKIFIQEQHFYSAIYSSQGKTYFDSWRDDPGKGDELDSSRKTSKPTEDVDMLDIGVGTPILKPRNPKTSTRTLPRPEDKGSMNEGDEENEACPGKERPVGMDDLRGVEKPKVFFEQYKRGKKPQSQNVIKEKKPEAQASDVDSEHVERWRERRERRKMRRNIVRPKQPDPPRSDDSISSNQDGERKGKRAPRLKQKPSKLPIGLALMHGFRASNVGKSRLTVERRGAPAGVFMKGRASAKTPTASKKKKGGFLEEVFLGFFDKKNQKKPKKKQAPATSSNASNSSSGTSETLDQPPRKKRKGLMKRAVDDVSEPSVIEELPRGTRARSESVVWDIERDSAILPSTAPSLPGRQSNNPMPVRKAGSMTVISPPGSRQQSLNGDANSDLSIAPSDSVSRYLEPEAKPRGDNSTDAQGPVVSRFFQSSKAIMRKGQQFNTGHDQEATFPSEPSREGDHSTWITGHQMLSAKAHHSDAKLETEPSLLPEPHLSPVGDKSHQATSFGQAFALEGIPPEAPIWEPYLGGELPEPILGPRGDNGESLPSSLVDYNAYPGLYDSEHLCYGSDREVLLGMPLGAEEPLSRKTGYGTSLVPGMYLGADFPGSLDEGYLCLDDDDCYDPNTFDRPVHAYDDNRYFLEGLDTDYQLSEDREADQGVGHPISEIWENTREGADRLTVSAEDSWLLPYEEEEAFAAGKASSVGSSVASDSGEEEQLCNFLQGRSLLLNGLEPYSGKLGPSNKGNGVQRAEADVAKALKDHWRPQKL